MRNQFLLEAAADARENAYAPYSEFEVGAAIETDTGVYKGANIEVSGRSTSVHAEMFAVFNAVYDGATEFHALAMVADCNDGPCALCLHTLSEFTQDIEIIIETDGGIETFDLADEFNNAYRPMNAPHHDHH